TNRPFGLIIKLSQSVDPTKGRRPKERSDERPLVDRFQEEESELWTRKSPSYKRSLFDSESNLYRQPLWRLESHRFELARNLELTSASGSVVMSASAVALLVGKP